MDTVTPVSTINAADLSSTKATESSYIHPFVNIHNVLVKNHFIYNNVCSEHFLAKLEGKRR